VVHGEFEPESFIYLGKTKSYEVTVKVTFWALRGVKAKNEELACAKAVKDIKKEWEEGVEDNLNAQIEVERVSELDEAGVAIGEAVALRGRPELVIKRPRKTVSEEQLQRFEAEHNLALPADYRQFLLSYNGGDPLLTYNGGVAGVSSVNPTKHP
jgi:hypothetical protein